MPAMGRAFLGLEQQARTPPAGVAKAEIVPVQGCDECCGFGGLFAVKMADISEAMLKWKVAAIRPVVLIWSCSVMSVDAADRRWAETGWLDHPHPPYC